jgi:hypothetical protein
MGVAIMLITDKEFSMKRIIVFAVMIIASAQALAANSCEDVKNEIAKKIEANGVKAYSLDIVDANADIGSKKVVGTCASGSKKIVYTRR